MHRALLATASLFFPPAGALALRSPAGRALLLALAAASAAVFFALWAGPGALMWGATGLAAALAVLLGRR